MEYKIKPIIKTQTTVDNNICFVEFHGFDYKNELKELGIDIIHEIDRLFQSYTPLYMYDSTINTLYLELKYPLTILSENIITLSNGDVYSEKDSKLIINQFNISINRLNSIINDVIKFKPKQYKYFIGK